MGLFCGLSACSGGLPDSDIALTPIIDLRCTTADQPACQATLHSRPFRVGIINGRDADCESLFRSAGSEIFTHFLLSSSGNAEFTGTELRATITEFVDFNNVSSAVATN